MENKRTREYLQADEPQIIATLGSGEPRIVFNVATHGNELQPLRAVEELLLQIGESDIVRGTVSFTMANPPAMRAEKRYLSQDMNRIYPGKLNGTGEEKLAAQMLAMLENPDYVVDFHTAPQSPPVVILGRPDLQRLELAEAAGIKEIVLFEAEKSCAMVDFVPCGIGIELGRHDDEASVQKGIEVMKNYLGNLEFMSTSIPRIQHEYYEVFGSLLHADISHLPHNLLQDFEQIDPSIFPLSEDEDVYPFLCGMRTYTPIHCFLTRKVEREYLTNY